jgi:hypothetical protein
MTGLDLAVGCACSAAHDYTEFKRKGVISNSTKPLKVEINIDVRKSVPDRERGRTTQRAGRRDREECADHAGAHVLPRDHVLSPPAKEKTKWQTNQIS